MTELRQANLHDRELPLGYLPLVRSLDRFINDSLEMRPRKGAAEASEVEDLRQQHDRLMADALAFFGGDSSGTLESDAERAMSLGLLRCTYYEATVLGDPPLVDTCGSLTLHDFTVDTAQGEEARREMMAWHGADLEELQDEISHELEELALRKAIMAALERRHPLAGAGNGDQVVKALFDELYPGNPFLAGEIDIIRTSTSVFFCLPFEDLRMDTPQWSQRTAAEKSAVEAFLRRWSKFKQRYYAHFPVFGFFRGQDIAPELLSALEDETGRSADDVADALTTMVAILQSKDVDKYIVHDAWGHQWQSLLFRFEDTYREVASFTTMPPLDARPAGFEQSLREVLAQLEATGDASLAERYLRAEIEDRLLCSLAGLVAEVLADVVEYKFILLRPEEIGELLSSSFFKDLPTKLDLTLWDLPWYFKIALRGFSKFAATPELQSQLASESGSPRGVELLAAKAQELLDFDFRRSLHYEVKDDHLEVNAFCRIALNFLAMQSVFNAIYDELRDSEPPTRPGIERFHDVLVFATASYFELDWSEHFWLIDEFLGADFPRLWDQVSSA